jgi:uncharacterized protein
MEDPNVTALHRVYAEWEQGQFTTWFDFFADDYEWGFSPEFPDGEVAADPARDSGQSERLRAWLSSWDGWRCAAERYVPIGDRVLVLTRYSGVAKSSGLSVDQEGAHVWRMRDGTALRLEVFPDRHAALGALGLEKLPED